MAGRVGTGFTDQELQTVARKLKDYMGKPMRIEHMGQFESGITAAWWGTMPAVVVGGIGTLVVAGLWMRWFPDLIKREVLVVKRE